MPPLRRTLPFITMRAPEDRPTRKAVPLFKPKCLCTGVSHAVMMPVPTMPPASGQRVEPGAVMSLARAPLRAPGSRRRQVRFLVVPRQVSALTGAQLLPGGWAPLSPGT